MKALVLRETLTSQIRMNRSAEWGSHVQTLSAPATHLLLASPSLTLSDTETLIRVASETLTSLPWKI
jgi:hypothetical protein